MLKQLSNLFYFWMQHPKKLQQLKQCYNDTFFTTQVSSHSPLNPQSSNGSKNFFRISSKLKEQPRVYFKKMKEKKQQAEQKCLQLLRSTVCVKRQLQKIQRDVGVFRNEFMKLYHNKKFRLLENDIVNEYKQAEQHSFRLSKENFMRRKMYRQLNISLQKEKRQREKEMFRETKRYNQKIFRQTLRMSEDRLNKISFLNTERVRSHKMDLAQSKKKLRELSITKCKFNYMSKINQQMKRIAEYNQQIANREDQLDYQVDTSSHSPRGLDKYNQY